VIYTEEGSPALTLGTAEGRQIILWDPPVLRSMGGMPLARILGNTGAPYALGAAALNDLLRTNSDLHVNKIDLKQTINIAAWRTEDGRLRVLAGNLEEGLRDDAHLSRNIALAIPKSWRIDSHTWRDVWAGREFVTENNLLPINLPQASSVLLEQSQ
jgi:hypothetical protein